MKKLLSIVLVGAFALSFVIGASVSSSHADVTLCKKMYCVDRLGGSYWYVCCPVPGFKGSPNSPKYWDCFVDFNLPCDIE